jgi:uncharacterized membrane protein YcaP (DUF421 family)
MTAGFHLNGSKAAVTDRRDAQRRVSFLIEGSFLMDTVWVHLMSMGAPIEEKVIRAACIYAFLIVGLRLAGKRELAQLNPFDLVVLLTLSNTVQNAIIGDDTSLIGGIIGAATLLLINYLVVRFTFHHPGVENLLEGRAVVLIEHGKLRHEAMKGQLINLQELKAAARRQGMESLEEVDTAVLESSGTLSFLRKEPSPEVTRYHEILTRLETISAQMLRLSPKA